MKWYGVVLNLWCTSLAGSVIAQIPTGGDLSTSGAVVTSAVPQRYTLFSASPQAELPQVPADPYAASQADPSSDKEAILDPDKPLTKAEVEKMIADHDRRRTEELAATTSKDGKKSADTKLEDKNSGEKKPEEKKEKKWYEKVAFRGYTQVRFNQELFENDPSAPAHYVGDRSVAEDQSFLIRRARLIFFGDVHEHLYVYFQPDFANTPTGSTDQNHFVQLRDLYGDVYLDCEKEFRLRVGQSKIPYGWENMQSSQNRMPLDRADALNSAARNERDLGVFFYYTPKYAQTFFKEVIDEGLKGSGNYGVFALGTYNGQGGSFQEQNDNLHVISRLTIPYQFCSGQRMETSLQGYIGEYVVLSSGIRPLGAGAGSFRPVGTLETGDNNGWNDKRIGATWVWYPQPLGFQTEWNVGRGPALNAAQTAIEDRALKGGYAMVNYKADNGLGINYPFARWSYYEGGYKSERNAPFAHINEWELGNEWQINTATDLTLAYLMTDRTNTTAATAASVAPYQQFDGHVLRAQFQFNY